MRTKEETLYIVETMIVLSFDSSCKSFVKCFVLLQSDPSSVRILKPSAKVSPELVVPAQVSDSGALPRCVFGVSLETLKEDGQVACGIPHVLRDMVEFLGKNGK